MVKFASGWWTVVVLTGCSSESRLWRLSPFSGRRAESSERANVWPLAYVDRDGAAILWPLIDFDSNGFAVRPLVSRDHSDLDVLFPLSHFDTESGEGWALTAYSYRGNRGLFPLCNFGPDLNFVGPAWWCRDRDGTSGGLFPLSYFDTATGEGWALTAYSYGGNRGLFPLCNFGPDLNFVGPVWWNEGDDGASRFGVFPIAGGGPSFGYVGPCWWNRGEGRDSFGLFPLFTHGDLSWVGPAWWHREGGGAIDEWGVFPLAWSDPKAGTTTVLPLYHRQHDAERDRTLLLVPPTYWETRADVQNHLVVPFYARFADRDSSFTIVPPLFAESTSAGRSHWFTPLADGWTVDRGDGGGRESGLDVYPLWWSSQTAAARRQMLLPFYYYREHGDDRLLLTPLGGRGWDASGESAFINVLGPVFHHSVGERTETTAVAWPLFERSREGETTSTRAIPFFGATQSPGRFDSWQLGGLGRYVADGASRSFRFFPLVSQIDAAESPDVLFDLTLARSHVDGDRWSRRFLPLYWGSGEAGRSTHSGLLGLARVATTDEGSAWRMWPLASGSNDPAADGLFDRVTLFRHERRDDDTREWLFPLYYRSSLDESSRTDVEILAPLFHHERTASGSSWRLWPALSVTDSPSVRGVLDPLTLVGVATDADRSQFHFGTPLLFSLDRCGADAAGSWDMRVACLFDAGHEERAVDSPLDASGPRVTVRRDHAGFLFDWFLVENRVVLDADGAPRDQSHFRLPLLHEYERRQQWRKWDLFCWAVTGESTPDSDKLRVFGGYAFRKDREGDTTKRDIFPFVTWDSAPDGGRVSFLWRLFDYEKKGDRSGGHILFVPWGDRISKSAEPTRGAADRHAVDAREPKLTKN